MRRGRSGMTLIEVILASALGAVVMAGLFQAIHLNWKYRISSERSNSESRKALSLIEDLTLDLRATLPPATQESASGTTASAALPQTDFSERFLAVEMSAPVEYLNFVGNSEAMLLLRTASNPRFNEADGEYSVLEQVAWWVPGHRAPRLPYATSGTQLRHRQFQAPQNVAGLCRASYSLQHFSKGGSGQERETLSVALRSISQIQFRYFDGKKWIDHWNSEKMGRIPVAVKFTARDVDSACPVTKSVVFLPQSFDRGGVEE
ncbi:prepilin-type N-terminal cleavage/methylation domain-containing protein [Planctomicrobium sp. SH661]|uniref:prepilin-type N-terminal cleavage/methylation domain-containing protein n=1 Tax=Planctomicrobium sp. SH661 TaxID=3448124 RepID=UPI003F5C6195